jgi:hypothetical protein
MIHRLLNFPLTKERYNIELKYIEEVAEFNGYSKNIIHNILRKSKHKIELSNLTTLKPIDKEISKHFISLPYHNVIKGLPKMLKKFDFKITHNNNNSLKNLLGNPKDKTDVLEKSGIYKIDCLNCNNSYIGQTRRSLQIRFKEHLAHLKYQRLDKSSVAMHMATNNHNTNIQQINLLKSVEHVDQLDAAESLEIIKHRDKLVNNGTGPIPDSSLLEFVADLSKVDG